MMSSVIRDVETGSAKKHKRLAKWVEESAQLCKPERLHWCDGSPEEYQAMLRAMVLSGTAIPLADEKRPNSVLVRSSPAEGAPGQEPTFIWRPTRDQAGPPHNSEASP